MDCPECCQSVCAKHCIPVRGYGSDIAKVMMHVQALLDAESPAKRTRLQAQDSPGRQAGVAAKRTQQLDALEQDLKQVMNYADEKVCNRCC